MMHTRHWLIFGTDISRSTESLLLFTKHYVLNGTRQARSRCRLPLTCVRDLARTISKEERDKLWRRSELYGAWIRDALMDDASTTNIMVLPVSTGLPSYRETLPSLVKHLKDVLS